MVRINYVILIIMIFLNQTISECGVDEITQNKFFDFKKTTQQQSPLVIDRKIMDANLISAWFRNDGEFFSDHGTTGPGFEWPKNSAIHAIFSAGLWLGAKVQTDTGREIRVATVGHFGSEYRPGLIINGRPDNYRKPEYRYYKVQPLKDHPTNPDYAEWPVHQGAPFYDANNDGNYNPDIDKPALLWGDKVVFPDVLMYAVYNDADPEAHTWIWGRSKPLGVEVRQTNWAFNSNVIALQNVVFSRFEIINKSDKIWDSLYFTIWADPDLGDAFDDYVGVDTSLCLNLAYCYNGDNNDGPPGYGLDPPSVGFKLLQGPVVHTGNSTDVARWSGREIPFAKNLNLSSFNFICKPSACNNPDWWYPSLYEQTYNVMKGLLRTGREMIDNTGQKTKFAFAGDPVTGTGWLNSHLTRPSDVHCAMSTGPITMSPGDTQQIILATMIARSSSNLQSINALRATGNLTQIIADNRFFNIPRIWSSAKYLSQTTTSVTVKCFESFADSILIILKMNENIIETFQLFDDGLHQDENPNDGYWGNNVFLVPNLIPYKMSAKIYYKDGTDFIWEEISSITTIGPVKVDSFAVAADNINYNFKANPGENVRIKFCVKQETPYQLSNLIFRIPPFYDKYIYTPGGEIPVLDSLLPNVSYCVPYSINSRYYIEFYISPSTPGDYVLRVPVELINYQENMWTKNIWYDTVYLYVESYDFQPRSVIPQHISGQAEGIFGLLLIDSLSIKNNDYKINIVKSLSGEKLFNLVNITIDDTLLKEHKMPTVLGYEIPITDGFKITRGNIVLDTGIRSAHYIPEINKWFKGTTPNYNADVPEYGVFYPRQSNFLNLNSAIDIEDLKTVEIRFSNHITQKAYRYLDGFRVFPPVAILDSSFIPYVLNRSGSGFIFQDYEMFPLGNPNLGRTVPFTVWEINHKTGEERQLNIAIVERNDTLYRPNGEYVGRGKIDGKWFPTTHSLGGGELLYIFSSTYSEEADTFYTNRNLRINHSEFDIYYVIWARLLNSNSTFTEGDILRIIPFFPLTVKDVFTFNPLKLLNVKNELLNPQTFQLFQNYPNPFNSLTNISYNIPKAGKVVLKIYNILGQEVITLVNDEQQAGHKIIQWDGKNSSGKALPSGVYFYKINAGDYTAVRKMLLLK